MKKYYSYKDSGVEWIGEIPSHWDTIRLCYLGNFSSSGIDKKINPDEELVKIINFTDIYNNLNGVLDSNTDYMIVSTTPNKKAEHSVVKGDLIFLPSSETYEDLGKSAIVNEEMENVSFSYHVIRLNFTRELSHGFKKYLTNNYQVLNQFSSNGQGTTRKIIGRNVFRNIKVVIPTIEEQTTIANYLDQKTSQIDDLIAKKERLIQLLEEERTAIINELVTGKKVWNGHAWTEPAEVKDSGIEWLGEIPVHWEIAKFNLFITIRHGHQFMNYDFTDDGIKVVKITQLHKDGYLDLSKCSYVSSEQLENYQSILIKEKDILMCLTGGTIGKIIRVGEVNEPLLQNYRVGHFSSGDVSKISDDFIFWLMSSESIVSQILFQMRETGQPNIGMEDFGRMRITIPPLEEQEGIVKYILNKTSEISEILIKSKQEIELLKEYKTALISEVVTGKVDVRNEKLS